MQTTIGRILRGSSTKILRTHKRELSMRKIVLRMTLLVEEMLVTKMAICFGGKITKMVTVIYRTFIVWRVDKMPAMKMAGMTMPILANLSYKAYIPLRYLSDYFDNESLRKKLDYFFWEDSFTISRSDICLRHAKLFFDDEASDKILDRFRTSFLFYDDFKCFMVDGDPEIWLDLLKRGNEDMRECLSTSLAKFCLKSETELDADAFLELTDAALLPKLTFEAAVSFLRAENMFLPESRSTDYLSSLQTRCVAALVENLHLKREGCLNDNFKHWNPLVVSKIVAAKPKIEKLQEEIAIAKYPREIGVYGAGTAAVNGLYEKNTNLTERFPRYTKRAAWPGRKNGVEFVLISVCEENERVCWYLSILHGETKMTDGSDIDFYVSSFAPLRDAFKHFPNVTWHKKGQLPVPRYFTFSSP